MKENKIDNNCINCGSCANDYIICNSMLLECDNFHCTNNNLKFDEREQRVKNKTVCEYWQPMVIKVNKREKSIKDLLYYIAKRLEDVASILKEDNETN